MLEDGPDRAGDDDGPAEAEDDARAFIDAEARERPRLRAIIPPLQPCSRRADPGGRVRLARDLMHVAARDAAAPGRRHAGAGRPDRTEGPRDCQNKHLTRLLLRLPAIAAKPVSTPRPVTDVPPVPHEAVIVNPEASMRATHVWLRPAAEAAPIVVRPVVREPVPEEGLLVCPDCSVALDLDQPGAHEDERLIGVCRGCGKWFLLVGVDDRDWEDYLAYELPTTASIRDAAPRGKDAGSRGPIRGFAGVNGGDGGKTERNSIEQS